MAFRFRSLRATLLIPFVSLVVAVAAAVTWLSYSAGLRAVDEVSRRMIEDVGNRLAQATRQHMATSEVVLNAVAPDAIARGATRGSDPEFATLSPTMISDFEKRLWLASGLFPDRNSYVYYGSETGRFVGIQRSAPGGPEVRLRAQPNEPRRVYRAISPEQRGALLREEAFDPHERPWYRLALERKALTWTPVYRDFSSGERIITLAKPVFRTDGTIRGVAATDVSLNTLVEFVRSLSIGENGVAYVLEPNGNVVAASVDSIFSPSSNSIFSDDSPLDTRALANSNVLVRESYEWLSRQSASSNRVTSTAVAQPFTPVQHAQYEGELGPTHVSVISYRDEAGLDWRFVVAAPRSDHMAPVYRAMRESLAIGGLAVLLTLLIGTWVFHRVAEDVSVVSRAAERLAAGHGPITKIPNREDEIGSLATSVAAIQDALLFDKLTGALNRAAFVKRFSLATGDMRHPEPLAIVYIDLDRFKKINDRYGHAVGDKVLAKSAERIRRRLRDKDLFARYGGDEFVVMVRGQQAVESIDALVTRLGERLRMGMNVGEHHVAVGASIGIAVYPDDGRELDELIAVADSRMYGEKRKTAEVRRLRKTVSYISAP
jgi:diguanylate cyclase (GGDEF)-like protein